MINYIKLMIIDNNIRWWTQVYNELKVFGKKIKTSKFKIVTIMKLIQLVLSQTISSHLLMWLGFALPKTLGFTLFMQCLICCDWLPSWVAMPNFNIPICDIKRRNKIIVLFWHFVSWLHYLWIIVFLNLSLRVYCTFDYRLG